LKTEQQINLRKQSGAKFWSNNPRSPVVYADIDPQILRLFSGTHPKAAQSWLLPADGLFQADPNHRLTSRERKHRMMLKLEQWFGFRFNKKHYQLVR
jgi:hypothetical protein